jgi:hypothetical protein
MSQRSDADDSPGNVPVAFVSILTLARRDVPSFDCLVKGSGHKNVIVLGVECDGGHLAAAMENVSYTVPNPTWAIPVTSLRPLYITDDNKYLCPCTGQAGLA